MDPCALTHTDTWGCVIACPRRGAAKSLKRRRELHELEEREGELAGRGRGGLANRKRHRGGEVDQCPSRLQRFTVTRQSARGWRSGRRSLFTCVSDKAGERRRTGSEDIRQPEMLCVMKKRMRREEVESLTGSS